MPHIDINDLHRERDKRTNVRNEIFNKILSRCHSRIKSISKLSDVCCCFFEVPAYVYGLPVYNQMECIHYIIKDLFDDGFKVEFAEPNILFITWYDKPKRKSLSDIAGDTRLPIYNKDELRRTNNYNTNNSLYHDGLSELELKSNHILNDPTLNINKKTSNNINQYSNNNRNTNQNRNTNTNRNINRNNDINKNDINYTRENRNFVDFNPSSNDNDFKEIRMNNIDDIKSFSVKSRPHNNINSKMSYNPNLNHSNQSHMKTADFRSLFNDSGKDSSYKKINNNNYNEISLDEIDRELGFAPTISTSPAPQNNIGFSPF